MISQVVLISAVTGQRLDKLIKAVDSAAIQFNRRVSTNTLNEIIGDALLRHPPPKRGSKAGKVHFSVQVGTRPPKFVLFCNDRKFFTDTYMQFLERKIRESLGFDGTPIKLFLKEKSERRTGHLTSKITND
jgi:GTP-binding protein